MDSARKKKHQNP